MKKQCLLTVLFCLLMAVTQATTYYMATTGNDNNAGSMEAPFATLAKAYTTAVAGDVIYIRGGTYVLAGTDIMEPNGASGYVYVFNMNKGGSGPSKRISILGYPGEQPVFDLSNIKPSGKRVAVFYVSKSYHYFKNFEIIGTQVTITTHTQSECFRVEGGNYNIFENLSMHDGMAIGYYLVKGTNNLVLNCDAYNNYDPVSEGGNGGNVDGFGAHPNSTTSTGNSFKGCRAWYNGDDGFDFINSLAAVTLDSCWAFYNGYKPPSYGNLLTGGDGTGFKAGGYGMGAVLASAQTLNPFPQHVVTNSIAYYNRLRGFYANHHLGGVVFIHNTAYRNAENFNMTNRSQESITLTSGTDVSGYGHIIKNNIAYSPRTAGANITNVNTSLCTIDNNTFLSSIAAISDNDFVSMDAVALMAARKSDGSLPDINFLKVKSGSPLFAANIGTLFDGNPSLPVSFGAVTAATKGSELIVNWTSLSEQNNNRYEIEASRDGKAFSKIGEVLSKTTSGNAIKPIDYEFELKIDQATIITGTSLFLCLLGIGAGRRKTRLHFLIISITVFLFYACAKQDHLSVDGNLELYIRIKQVDKDGGYKYSSVVKAVAEK